MAPEYPGIRTPLGLPTLMRPLPEEMQAPIAQTGALMGGAGLAPIPLEMQVPQAPAPQQQGYPLGGGMLGMGGEMSQAVANEWPQTARLSGATPPADTPLNVAVEDPNALPPTKKAAAESTPGTAGIPGGMMAAGKTVQKGIDLPFGPRAFMSSSQRQAQAAMRQAESLAAQGRALSAEYMRTPEERAEIAAEHEERRADVQAKIAGVEADIARMEKKALEGKIDPDRYWKNAGIMRKSALVMAAGMAGAAQGLGGGGGPQQIYAGIMGLINMDIKAQMVDLQSAAKVRGEKMGLLSMLNNEVKDLRTAEALAFKRLAFDAADRIKGIAEGTKGPAVIAAADQAAAMLKTKGMQAANAAAAAMADKTSTMYKARGGAGKRALGAGGAGVKLNKEDENKLKAAIEATAREDRYISSLMKYRAETTIPTGLYTGAKAAVVGKIPGTEAERLKGARGQIVSLAVKALSGVTARPDEIARIEPNYPSPWDSPSMVASKMVNQLSERRTALMAVLEATPNAAKRDLFIKQVRDLDSRIAKYRKLSGG